MARGAVGGDAGRGRAAAGAHRRVREGARAVRPADRRQTGGEGVRVVDALRPSRVLDLTPEIGQYAGRCFAEMGAEVIKVEPPAGDAVRRIGPFLRDEPGPDPSPLWFV